MKMSKAYIEAYAASSDDEGPSFAAILVTPQFLERLKKLTRLCVENGLSELRIYDSPDAWGPGDIETELRLTCGELVVTGDSFWFVDQPKNADYHIETRALNVEEFCRIVESSSDEVLYYGESDDLEEVVAREEKEHTPS